MLSKTIYMWLWTLFSTVFIRNSTFILTSVLWMFLIIRTVVYNNEFDYIKFSVIKENSFLVIHVTNSITNHATVRSSQSWSRNDQFIQGSRRAPPESRENESLHNFSRFSDIRDASIIGKMSPLPKIIQVGQLRNDWATNLENFPTRPLHSGQRGFPKRVGGGGLCSRVSFIPLFPINISLCWLCFPKLTFSLLP